MSEPKHSVRFPGESEAYRSARDELLDDEIELRRQVEAVAAKRRDLPLGGEVPEDYVFVRRDGRLYHAYNTEALYAPADPGQEGRHVDLIWPLWNLFDLTPEGRGENWYPRLSY